MGPFSTLWRAARLWPDPGMGLRPGSGAAVLAMFLILVFALVGVVLVSLGFDLNDVDAWLKTQQGWMSAAGDIAFKIFLAFVCLCAALSVAASLLRRVDDKHAPDWGLAALMATIGYFAWAGLSG